MARLLLALTLMSSTGLLAPKPDFTVNQSPRQPTSNQAVQISISFDRPPIPKTLTLQYQINEPGRYIALEDPEFQSGWHSIEMSAAAKNSSEPTRRRGFVATVPSRLQNHRGLVRYRIIDASAGSTIAPPAQDSGPNYAYFVYDGVPDWHGAINPKSKNPELNQVFTVPTEALTRVSVYHFISKKSSVENVTWREQIPFGYGRGRNAYRYTGTMVYDGIVYDHIQFRARGGQWRHSMGKNMWKFNFRKGHRFRARDNYGRRYQTKWDKLNLGACIQQNTFGMRGEQGM